MKDFERSENFQEISLVDGRVIASADSVSIPSPSGLATRNDLRYMYSTNRRYILQRKLNNLVVRLNSSLRNPEFQTMPDLW